MTNKEQLLEALGEARSSLEDAKLVMDELHMKMYELIHSTVLEELDDNEEHELDLIRDEVNGFFETLTTYDEMEEMIQNVEQLELLLDEDKLKVPEE